MKMLSNQAVTRDDLNDVDDRQTKQIIQLRWAVAASFIVNLFITASALFYYTH